MNDNGYDGAYVADSNKGWIASDTTCADLGIEDDSETDY